MKIGIISNSYDDIPNIQNSAEIFHDERVEVILHGVISLHHSRSGLSVF